MKKIKFRGFSKYDNKMRNINRMNFNNDNLMFEGMNVNWSKSETIIMQYTGLKDKHEKDIYEGDIVTWDKCPEYKYSYNKSIPKFNIIWQDKKCGFGMKSISKDRYRDYNMQSGKNLEVIGNIYENSELVEEK